MNMKTIHWEVDGYSGSSTINASRLTDELDQFKRAGYRIVSVEELHPVQSPRFMEWYCS